MHARRAFRGMAAVLLSAALIAGGAFATPAFASEDPATAATQTDEIASAPPVSTSDPEGLAAPDAPMPAQDPIATGPEDSDSAAELDTNEPVVQPEAPQTAPEPAQQGDSALEPSSPLPQAVDAEAMAPELTLAPKITPKQRLEVHVTATRIPAQITQFSAALILKGTEPTLTGPRPNVPALADPQPEVVNGSATFTLAAPIATLTQGMEYVVVLWPTEGPADDKTIIARADLTITAGQWSELFGTTTPKPDPAWNSKAAVGSFEWGVRDKFRSYVTGPIAKGKITLTKPATGTNVYKFPQVSNDWKPGTRTGTVQFAGNVNFWGHDGVLDLNLANPEIVIGSDPKKAQLLVPYGKGKLTIADIDLTATNAAPQVRADGSIRYAGTKVTLNKDGRDVYFQGYMTEDLELAPLAFTIGANSQTEKPVTPPPTKPIVKPKPKPVPKPLPPTTGTAGGTGGAQAAGSLSWGVSSAFAKYVTGPIAKGEVSTTGVGGSGGAYLFPQAAGGSWDTATQTGSVQYSGVVSFTGHKGLLQEGVSNPMIQVTGPDTAVIYSGGAQWGTLNLGAASKSVGANGEVTWSGVPVNGGFSGGASGGNQYSLPADPLTFTVGVASGVSYGSTAVSNASLKRTAASAPPTTTGIRILTDAKELVPGGEIEFEAAGFESKEREALVVLYPGAIVLDEAAGADAAGTLRWLGTIPEDTELGEYVITVQGSTDAGAVIEVREPEKKSKAAAKQKTVEELAAETTQAAPAAAGILPTESSPVWVWWAASAGLLLIAGTMGGLVVAQRKRAAAGVDTQLSSGNAPPAP
ncbi:Htaa protein [Leucobacter luti]|uniref:HtaA domain-containing protein n=1 Tax=Leucobacter luti TaxID=340320 RepID=UPI001046B85A|nr:HtaA domain-containing protein [Leucobacter luti]MCW2288788.1 hypothetical protein [Leucobacter luti]TCK45060.1 Htaa protein [Leucobacter luti]